MSANDAAMSEAVARLRRNLASARAILDDTWQWPEWTGVHDNTDNARAALNADETRITDLDTVERLRVNIGAISIDRWQETAYWIGDDISKQVGYAVDNSILEGLRFVTTESRDDLVEGINEGAFNIIAYVQQHMPWLIPATVGIVLFMVILAVAF